MATGISLARLPLLLASLVTTDAALATSTASPNPTTLASTRFLVDRFAGQPFYSDATVSVGASASAFSDGLGTLTSTAVLIRTPQNVAGDSTAWMYRPSRVDFYLTTFQTPAATQAQPSSYNILLFADDNSTEHAPAEQLAPPFRVTGSKTLVALKGAWFQEDLGKAGWPLLAAGTYYWIALAPAVAVSLAGATKNGAAWLGILPGVGGSPNLPAAYAGDDSVFSARQLTSMRFRSDTAFACNGSTASAWLSAEFDWPSVPYASARYTDWQAKGSAVRYGVQLLGWQMFPSASATSSRAYPCCVVRSLSFTSPCALQALHSWPLLSL